MRKRALLVATLIGAALLIGQPAVAIGADDQAASTKAADDQELVMLRAENKMLKAALEKRDKELTALKQEMAALKGQNSRPSAAPQAADVGHAVQGQAAQVPEVTTEKKVVLTAREFNSLPRGRQTGKPLGFTNLTANAVGYVNTALVIHVVNEATAVVEVLLSGKDGTLLQPDVAKRIVIEGVPTQGQADNGGWALNGWFKVVDSRNIDGTNYLVAWPITQAGRVSTARSTAGR